MGQTPNIVKQRWNAVHYSQVKISVERELASAFKAACTAAGVSMASVLSQHMKEFSLACDSKNTAPDYSTRRKRRAAVMKHARQLSIIMDAEIDYEDRIPENLHGSIVFERAEETISVMGEAIELLNTAY